MRRSRATSTAEGRIPRSTPRYRFVAGKGGVGKTTLAAAMGIRSAESGVETLVISIDPAPSLGDAFGQRLGPKPRPIRERPGLYAVELDAAAALSEWIAPRRATLEQIALRGTWLDHTDVAGLLKLSLPGIDEVAALLEIAGLADDPRYDRIIVDTAPTGHLLRMLGLPQVLAGFGEVFDHMQQQHRIMVDALRGRWTPDAADALIDEIRGDAQALGDLLRDPSRSRVCWVTMPELMPVEETADGIRWLAAHRIAIDLVVMNRITAPPPGRCRWCSARRIAERRATVALRGLVGSTLRVCSIPALEKEPTGVPALHRIGRMMESPDLRRATKPRSPMPVTARLTFSRSDVALADVVLPETRLLMFGGKGGVGKTTCAAALAIDLAKASRSRVLLLSTDPAHSVGDVLGQTFSDVPRRVRGGPGNLWVRELSSTREYRRLREQFAGAIDELFSARSRAIDAAIATADRQIMQELLELAPPGVDELVALVSVTETLVPNRRNSLYDLIVIDMAPTGHALRLVEMPALVHRWVKALMAILLKYQPLVGVGQLGSVLVRLSGQLRRLREVMTDPIQTRFVAVTRAAALPRAETVRLIKRLESARIDAPVVIVNALGAGSCSRCRADAAAQHRDVAALRKALGRRVDFVFTPAVVPPPLGYARLGGWRATWGSPRETGGNQPESTGGRRSKRTKRRVV